MSSPRLNLVLGGEPVLDRADPFGAAAPDGSLHLHIHLGREGRPDREDHDPASRDAGEGRPGKGYTRPVLLGFGAAVLAVASFYAGQHDRATASGGAMPAAAIAAAPAARPSLGSAAPVLPGAAADALPPALRAQLAAPSTVIPPPGASSSGAPVTVPGGPPRAKNPFGLGD